MDRDEAASVVVSYDQPRKCADLRIRYKNVAIKNPRIERQSVFPEKTDAHYSLTKEKQENSTIEML